MIELKEGKEYFFNKDYCDIKSGLFSKIKLKVLKARFDNTFDVLCTFYRDGGVFEEKTFPKISGDFIKQHIKIKFNIRRIK